MVNNPTDLSAVRMCARICWQKRGDLGLSATEVEQTLIAWMAVGENAEAEAASELLSALREKERRQAHFDELLR